MMIDKVYQLRLLSGILQDYSSGLVELGVLVNKVEGILGVVNDPALTDEVFDSLATLDEIYGYVRTSDFDFENEGKEIVEREIRYIGEIVVKYTLGETAEETQYT